MGNLAGEEATAVIRRHAAAMIVATKGGVA